MLFVTKGKKKKFIETKFLPPSLYMKILRANFVSCGRANSVNQQFEILNLVDYGWKVSEEKLERSWFEGSVISSIEDIDQEQNYLDTLPDVSESTDNTSSDLRIKIKVFAYLIRTVKNNRTGHCGNSNTASVASLKFLYMEILN